MITRRAAGTQLLASAVTLAGAATLTGTTRTARAAEPTPIRIGWQTTWATQGQIAQVLRHTDVLRRNGLAGRLVGASYGAPLNEAALASEVDVIFTADQPAAALLGRSPDWTIVGRLMFNRVALYVPPQSPIRAVADLKGRTIAMPFGAAAQRIALKALADAGLDPRRDIRAVNLDITEQAGIVKRGNLSSWGEIDAMAGFDPMVAVLETSGAARLLHTGRVTSVIVMARPIIERDPEAPVRFLKAFQEAVLYYARNTEQANRWFLEAAQLSFGPDVLALAAAVEPNLRARRIEEVSIALTPELIAGMQEAADFLLEQKLIRQRVDMASRIDQRWAERAHAELVSAPYDPAAVRVVDERS